MLDVVCTDMEGKSIDGWNTREANNPWLMERACAVWSGWGGEGSRGPGGRRSGLELGSWAVDWALAPVGALNGPILRPTGQSLEPPLKLPPRFILILVQI